MDQKIVQMPVTLAQAIANYLTARPYREVAGLLAEMAKLQPVDPPKPPGQFSAAPGEQQA